MIQQEWDEQSWRYKSKDTGLVLGFAGIRFDFKMLYFSYLFRVCVHSGQLIPKKKEMSYSLIFFYFFYFCLRNRKNENLFRFVIILLMGTKCALIFVFEEWVALKRPFCPPIFLKVLCTCQIVRTRWSCHTVGSQFINVRLYESQGRTQFDIHRRRCHAAGLCAKSSARHCQNEVKFDRKIRNSH